MDINPHIFRANDIRGIAYDDLNENVVVSLGKALGSESLSRNINQLIVVETEALQSGYFRVVNFRSPVHGM